MASHEEEQFGKYTVHGELGRGGFAVVYQAHDTLLRRDVALKLLHPQLLTDPAFVTRFENDARATAQLDHPRIATIYELGHYQGRMFMAVQLLAGGSLAERIKAQGRLPFAEAARVVDDIAQALDYAHAAGFIHRDVKPSNILFNRRGDAILTDFGLVKAAESSVIARTTMGGMIGTPAYMAPEIWEGQSDGLGTDVYALGCVLFEMLSGELLFTGATPPAVMLAHFQPHRYPKTWPDGTPSAIETVLERALARDPAARYASAGALAADLHALTEQIADPLAEPYAALAAALANQQWDHAAKLAQEITARDASYRNIRTLADQANAGQRQAALAREAAQWRSTALAAERSGQPDAARAAARQWLVRLPDNAEARALLQRLESTESRGAAPQPNLTPDRGDEGKRAEEAESRAAAPQPNLTPDRGDEGKRAEEIGSQATPTNQPQPRSSRPIAIISACWAAGCIASISLAWLLEGDQTSANAGMLIGWAIGWACAGLLAGWRLWLDGRAGQRWQILWLVFGWPLCMTATLILAALAYGTQPNTAILELALGAAVAGGIAGVAIRGLGQSLTAGQLILLALSWAGGWLLAEAGLNDGAGGGPWHGVLYKLSLGSNFHQVFSSYSQLNVIILGIAGTVGAILGVGLLWLFGKLQVIKSNRS